MSPKTIYSDDDKRTMLSIHRLRQRYTHTHSHFYSQNECRYVIYSSLICAVASSSLTSDSIRPIVALYHKQQGTSVPENHYHYSQGRAAAAAAAAVVVVVDLVIMPRPGGSSSPSVRPAVLLIFAACLFVATVCAPLWIPRRHAATPIARVARQLDTLEAEDEVRCVAIYSDRQTFSLFYSYIYIYVCVCVSLLEERYVCINVCLYIYMCVCVECDRNF